MSPKRREKGCGWYVVNGDKTITNKKKYMDADGNVYCKSFRGSSKAEAKRIRETWEHVNNIADHRLVITSMSVPTYMYMWLNTYKKNSVGESTYDSIEDCIESRVKGYELEHYQISQLTPSIMQEHINALVENEYARATIAKTSNILRNCFNKAVSLGDMVSNPMALVELPSERKVSTKAKKIQFYTPEDMEKIYVEANRRCSNGKLVYQHGQAIVLMLYTGMRIGECLGLKWGCVDFEKKRITISNSIIRVKNRDPNAPNKTLYKDSDPKTDSSCRAIPLSSRALQALLTMKELDAEHTGPNDYVAQSELHNRASERNIRRTLHIITETAGTEIQGGGLHVLRHTFASYAIYKGMDIITLSKILGHSKPSVTSDIYVGVMESQKVSAIELLDK